jgi:hypothetical protein
MGIKFSRTIGKHIDDELENVIESTIEWVCREV